MSGLFKGAQATVRVKVANTGQAFPETGAITCYSMLVTAAENNAGTVYLKFHATAPICNATVRRTTLVPLTKGQSVSLTGPTVGAGNQRAFRFGAGYSYVVGSATSQRLILTYSIGD